MLHLLWVYRSLERNGSLENFCVNLLLQYVQMYNQVYCIKLVTSFMGRLSTQHKFFFVILMESLFNNFGQFKGVKHMNCGATKHTEQRYKYAVDWLRYCLHGALYRLL